MLSGPLGRRPTGVCHGEGNVSLSDDIAVDVESPALGDQEGCPFKLVKGTTNLKGCPLLPGTSQCH